MFRILCSVYYVLYCLAPLSIVEVIKIIRSCMGIFCSAELSRQDYSGVGIKGKQEILKEDRRAFTHVWKSRLTK